MTSSSFCETMTADSWRLKMLSDSIFLLVRRNSETRLSVASAIVSTRFWESAPLTFASTRFSIGASSCCAETVDTARIDIAEMLVAAVVILITVALKLIIQSLLGRKTTRSTLYLRFDHPR